MFNGTKRTKHGMKVWFIPRNFHVQMKKYLRIIFTNKTIDSHIKIKHNCSINQTPVTKFIIENYLFPKVRRGREKKYDKS